MTTIATTRAGKIENITSMLNRLPQKDLDELEKQLRALMLMLEAKHLDASVQQNDITMDEIVEEVKKVSYGN